MAGLVSFSPAPRDHCLKPVSFRTVVFWVLSAFLWSAAVLYGFNRLYLYEAGAGKMVSTVPEVWPSSSAMQGPGDRPLLLMFAHPQCPCTRASIHELEKMMAPLYGRIQTTVLFARPSGFTDAQVKDGLWKNAEKIPGVHVFVDEGNKEASLFRSHTSGEAYLYGADGKLLFHGGITSARGHEGDNAGSRAVQDWILKGKALKKQNHVFGCSLGDRVSRKGNA